MDEPDAMYAEIARVVATPPAHCMGIPGETCSTVSNDMFMIKIPNMTMLLCEACLRKIGRPMTKDEVEEHRSEIVNISGDIEMGSVHVLGVRDDGTAELMGEVEGRRFHD